MDVPRIFEVQHEYQCLVFTVLSRIELNPPSNNIMKRAIYKTYNQIPSYTVVQLIIIHSTLMNAYVLPCPSFVVPTV